VYVSCLIHFLLKRVELQINNSVCGNVWWATKSHSNCIFISLNTCVFNTSWPTCNLCANEHGFSGVCCDFYFNFSNRKYSVYKLGILLCSLQVVCVCVCVCVCVFLCLCNFNPVKGIIYWTCDPKWFQSEKCSRYKYLNIEWYVHFLSAWYLSHSQVWSLFTYVTVFQSNKEHDKENTGCYRSCLTKIVKYLTVIILTCVQFFICNCWEDCGYTKSFFVSPICH